MKINMQILGLSVLISGILTLVSWGILKLYLTIPEESIFKFISIKYMVYGEFIVSNIWLVFVIYTILIFINLKLIKYK